MINSRKSSPSPTYQILEPRKLLAGDVTVTVDGSALRVVGDADANQIQIIGRADGSAVVTGLDGTTINGGSAEFSADADLRTAQIELGDGNDEVEIRGLVLRNALTVRTGGGSDSTDIQHINVRGIEVSAEDGNDVLQFDNVFSRSSIVILGGDGDDTVAIGAMAANGDGVINTGNGNDSLAVDNLGIKENMNLLFGNGDDQALIAGETYGYRGNIVLGAGDDTLSVLPATNEAAARFRRNLTVSGNSGDDIVALDANVTANRRAQINGGTDNDAIEQGDANLRRSTIRNFESEEVADLSTRLDAFYATLAASSIDTTRFGGSDSVLDVEPTLTVTATALSQTRDGDPQSIDDALTLTGDDDEVVSSATVSIGGFQEGEEELAFTDTDDITGAFVDGTLTLTGETGLEQYQAALRSVTYAITSAVPSTADRSLNLTVNFADTDESPVTGSRTVNVVAENLLTVSSTALAFNDGGAATAIDDGLLLAGNASTEITGATIALSNFDDGIDQLTFTDIGAITGAQTVSDDSDVATLTLTGEGTVAEYQTALRSITFQSTGDITAPSTRTVDFVVTTNDGDLTGSRTINIEQSTNEAPVLASLSTPVVMNVANVDGSGDVQPVSIIPSTVQTLITDVDSTQLGQAIVTIDDGRVDGDVLAFTEQAGITGTFDATTGVLVFAGDAAVEDYEAVLRSVTFGVSDAANIGQRTVSIEVTDVANGSAAAATDQTDLRIDVVSSQTARVTASAIAQELGTGESLATVDPSVLVVGGDDAVVTGATVQLSSGYQTGEDELSFVPVFSNPEVSGSFDAATGTLTLTGDASAEVYQNVLRNVVYENTVSDASARTEGDRTVIFTVNSDTTISDTRVVRQGTFDRAARDEALLDQYVADNNLTVQTTSTGLRYIVETTGNDVFPVATDRVRVNYTGTLLNGSEFDANDDITFSLLQVIPGWTEGFQFFSEGSSGQLLIPSDLAYANNPRDGIPTNSILIFDIDLLEVDSQDLSLFR